MRRLQGVSAADRQGCRSAHALGDAAHATSRARPSTKLDVLANDIMMRSCEWGGQLAGMVSEELEPYAIPSMVPARTLPAAVRSARRLLQHRRQRLGGHDLLDPALPDAG
jgi:hypothetical protein